MDTYIKVFRRMLNWGWYKDANTFRVFMHILLKANYSPSEYFGHRIGAGECVFGRQKWAKELDMSEQNIRTAINHLKSTNEITTRATNKFTVITVVKWDFWQMGDGDLTNGLTNELTNDQPTTNQQLTTSKEYKNIRNKEINNNRTKFTKPSVDEINDYIREKNLSVDADKFYDYYESNGWKVGKNSMKDWKATLRNWSRTNDSRTGSNSKGEWNRADNNSGSTTSYDRRNRNGNSDPESVRKCVEAIESAFEVEIDYSAL